MRDPVERSRLAIHDVLDSIGTARVAVAGLDFEEFQRSTINRLAAERCIEIISEGSRRISEDLKKMEPSISTTYS